MTHVGAQSNILKASPELKSELQGLGRKERFSANQALFREDDSNTGVFLLLSGKVCMSVKGLPKLDRIFRRLAAGIAFNIYRTYLQPDSRSRDRIGGRSRGPGRFCAVNA
jgi:hypothetical protein